MQESNSTPSWIKKHADIFDKLMRYVDSAEFEQQGLPVYVKMSTIALFGIFEHIAKCEQHMTPTDCHFAEYVAIFNKYMHMDYIASLPVDAQQTPLFKLIQDCIKIASTEHARENPTIWHSLFNKPDVNNEFQEKINKINDLLKINH